MRRILIIGITWSCLTASVAWTSAAGAASKSASKGAGVVAKDGWPETRAGALARRWVEAFSKGEKAMRETLPEILAPENLAKTSMDERMERYRGAQERIGSLVLVKIEKSTPGELVAVLAASDLSQSPYTFKVQTKAPYKLLSVTHTETRHMMHGGGFSH